MKKYVLIALFGMGVLALGGCGNSKDKAPAEATTQAQDTLTSRLQPVELDAHEYMELGEYKGLTVESESVTVTDQEVEEELELLAEDYAEYEEITDRDVVKKKDILNMDYTSVVDGEENEGYSDSEVDIEIGEGEFDIDGALNLDKELIGAKVGDVVKVQFTFPENYDDAEVAGKSCDMEVTVNKIQKKIVPEITDEFIKENTECATVEEYKKQTKKELQESYDSEKEQNAQEELWQQIMDNCKQKKPFPDDAVKQEMDNQLVQNEDGAAYFGMETEEYIQEMYGYDLETYAKDVLKQNCVLDLLLEAEKITSVSDEEYKAEIQTYIDDYGYSDMDEVLEYYTEDEIKTDIMRNKLMDNLMNYANIVEVSGDSGAEEAE